MQSSFSFRLPREDEEKLLSPHEYIRDTLSFRYQNCISCGTKTEFTCIKCGYCYSCHWKKEQVEKIELRNNLKDFYLLLSKDRDDGNSQKLKSQKQEQKENNESTIQRETKKWETLDALGQPAEPICTYYRCHHKFSLHDSRRCRCKHPTNKTLGIFVKYH
jgi:hypothetical protein